MELTLLLLASTRGDSDMLSRGCDVYSSFRSHIVANKMVASYSGIPMTTLVAPSRSFLLCQGPMTPAPYFWWHKDRPDSADAEGVGSLPASYPSTNVSCPTRVHLSYDDSLSFLAPRREGITLRLCPGLR
jgi:hypothetical protein